MKFMMCVKLALYVILFTVVISTSESSNETLDYCKIKCGGEEHTMCKYKAGGGAQCSRWKTELSKAEEYIITKEHNYFRKTVAIGYASPQPPGSNMLQLEWSDEAAEIARRWAEQCEETGSDTCRTTKAGVVGGQNIASVEASGRIKDRIAALRNLVLVFYEERIFLDPKNIASFESVPSKDNYSVDHYTQLVWATTSQLGCAYSVLEQNRDYKYKLVCNYYPSGNIKGKPMYIEGAACLSCPANTTCSKEYEGLCSSPSPDKPNDPNRATSAKTTELSFTFIFFGIIGNLVGLLQTT